MKIKKNKGLPLLLSVAMLFCMIPIISLAVAVDEPVCPNHQTHTADCGYKEATLEAACTHIHDSECGFIEERLEHACNFVADKTETDPKIQAEHIHDENCGYAEAIIATPCTHGHNEECDYQEPMDANICTHICELCNEKLPGITPDQEVPNVNTKLPDVTVTETEQDMVSPSLALATPRAVTMSFYIQAFDEKNNPLQGSAKYQPGLMSEYPSHSIPNKFGTVNVSPIKSENDEYIYFAYGTNDNYKAPDNPTIKLPTNKSLIKVYLALKTSGDSEKTTIEVLEPGATGYPEDPMNPGGGEVTTKELKGKVTDQDGKGVADAEVTARHIYMPPMKTVKTDVSGNYSIALPETQFGTFSLSAYKKDYKMSEAYNFDFVGCDASKQYDFKATDSGTLPIETFKTLRCSISDSQNVTTDVTLEITGMDTETFAIKGSSPYSKNLDKVLYAGKTITLTPKARGYRFEPVSQSFHFDAYESEIPASFACKTDGTRKLIISAVESSDKDIYNVKYKVTAGDTCEYYTGGQSAMIALYDAFYLNKNITVVPSKEGYTFDPPYITFLHEAGGIEYTKSFKGTPITDTTKKDLIVIVTDDKTGDPISDVSVSLGNITSSQKKTDSKGFWSLEGLREESFPNGTAELTLSKLGYEFVPRLLAFGDVGTIAISQSEALNNNEKTVNVVLNANPTEGGKVYGGGNIPVNEAVHLTAVPNTGYIFVGWSVYPSTDIYYSDANTSFIPTSNLKWQGNFKNDGSTTAPTTAKLTIKPNIDKSGSATGSGDYPKGVKVNLYANANAGYKFSHWLEGTKVLSVSTSYQITTTDNARTIEAVFEKIGGTSPDLKYQITTTANPTVGGTVLGTGEYSKNTSITVAASPNTGYNFVNWTENNVEVSTQTSYPFSVDSERTLVANFKLASTDPEEPDPGEPDPGEPDPGEPDPGEPDPGEPDPGEPDPGEPDPGEPDPGEPDPGKPDPVKPDSGNNSSGNNSSGNNSSGNNSSSNNSSGNNSSSNSSSGTNLKPQTVPTQGKAEATVTVDKNGSVTANIANITITKAVKAAQDKAKGKGTEKNGISITINVNTDKSASSPANSIVVNLPKVSIDQLVEANVKETKIQSDKLSVTLNLVALEEIRKNIDSDVIINVIKSDVKKFSSTMQKAIGNRPVFDISIVGMNNKNISRFKKGKMNVAIPYTLGKNEKAENLYGVFVDSSGKMGNVIGSKYDPINKLLLLNTNQFSTYGVAYKKASKQE